MSTERQRQHATELLHLHHGDGFILPNAWDGGSARILEQAGFAAVATTSAGISFAAGHADGTMSRAAMLDAVSRILAVVDCPVSADLESGYGETADDVAATVTDAVALGIAGANLEDSRPDHTGLFEVAEFAARLAAGRDAAPTGTFVLNARIDTYLTAAAGADPEALFAATIERAEAVVAAGADSVFVPGPADLDTVGRLVKAIAAPVNIVMGLGPLSATAAELYGLGVARITVGGGLTRASLGLVERAATELIDDGTFGFGAGALPHQELQRRFSTTPQH